MKRKIDFIILFIATVIVVLICYLAARYDSPVYKNINSRTNIENFNTSSSTENIVGNDRDEHGCIGSAGYSWCQEKAKCLRPWEEQCIAPIDTKIVEKMNSVLCSQKGGDWYAKENVCEINSLTGEVCTEAGGEFNPCASACRHNPTADICTLQCVLTCTFR